MEMKPLERFAHHKSAVRFLGWEETGKWCTGCKRTTSYRDTRDGNAYCFQCAAEEPVK
jgi:hypothetical protein